MGRAPRRSVHGSRGRAQDAAKIPGITYSDNVAHLEITLRDDGRGNLTATRTLTDDAGGTVVFDDKGNLKAPATFTNVYAARRGVRQRSGGQGAGGPRHQKGGRGFAFTVEGVGDASKAKRRGRALLREPRPGERLPRAASG